MWLMDFTGWSLVNSVLIKTVPETANILRSYYPERLALDSCTTLRESLRSFGRDLFLHQEWRLQMHQQAQKKKNYLQDKSSLLCGSTETTSEELCRQLPMKAAFHEPRDDVALSLPEPELSSSLTTFRGFSNAFRMYPIFLTSMASQAAH
ncbi:hypothetical protein MUK42_06588 [Musa troglodytarum]|uniref:Uncharacterized protein n=1 Tax=Musa troglodytarum TaxID=320322 RepID=A0A9E7GTM6_9LILI|nr:hypothetical protein MUK42_06588 [Musa troglodytarum]